MTALERHGFGNSLRECWLKPMIIGVVVALIWWVLDGIIAIPLGWPITSSYITVGCAACAGAGLAKSFT